MPTTGDLVRHFTFLYLHVDGLEGWASLKCLYLRIIETRFQCLSSLFLKQFTVRASATFVVAGLSYSETVRLLSNIESYIRFEQFQTVTTKG